MLYSVAAFYKNDCVGGIGVTITQEAISITLEAMLDEIENSWMAMYRECQEEGQEQVDALIQDLFGQLHAIGDGAKDSIQDMVITIGNVWLLQKLELIEQDEFNGMLYTDVT